MVDLKPESAATTPESTQFLSGSKMVVSLRNALPPDAQTRLCSPYRRYARDAGYAVPRLVLRDHDRVREPLHVLSFGPLRIVRTPALLYSMDRQRGEWLTELFAPAHRLDRELRPDVWRETTETLE